MMIVEQLVVGMMGVCCYIAACDKTKKCVVIDPGGDEKKILALIAGRQWQAEYVINTHGHPDHVCGNKVIKDATGARIVMHEEDAGFFGKPEIIQFFSMLGLAGSPPADKTVKDGDVIEFGEVKLTVIHTPGHTPGGICLYHKPDLFTGDTLFSGGGVGRTDFPGGSATGLAKSIRERLFTLPEETVIWPGHGYGGDRSTIGREKRDNSFV